MKNIYRRYMNAADMNQTTLIIIFYLTRLLWRYTEYKMYSLLQQKREAS